MKDLKHIKGFNESEENLDIDDSVTLQEVMDEFYEEYESSYIDGNTHGVIVKLIEELKKNKLLLGGEWE